MNHLLGKILILTRYHTPVYWTVRREWSAKLALVSIRKYHQHHQCVKKSEVSEAAILCHRKRYVFRRPKQVHPIQN